MRQLNSELKLEAAMCIHAHAICFGKVNKGARFVYYFSLKTNFYENCSENFKFDPPGALLDFGRGCMSSDGRRLLITRRVPVPVLKSCS